MSARAADFTFCSERCSPGVRQHRRLRTHGGTADATLIRIRAVLKKLRLAFSVVYGSLNSTPFATRLGPGLRSGPQDYDKANVDHTADSEIH
jgi:hypothetical protein